MSTQQNTITYNSSPSNTPPLFESRPLLSATASSNTHCRFRSHESIRKAEIATEDLVASKSILMEELEDPRIHHSENQKKPLRQHPRNQLRPPKCDGNFCLAWLVIGFQVLILFVMAILVSGIIFYAVFKPRIPKFSVDNFQILSFAVGVDATVSSQFVVGARSTNPNKKIGIYYLADSYVRVFFSGAELSRGKFPAFYQGHETITTLQVVLAGSDVQLNNKQITLLNAERVDGSIPLYLKAALPVKFKVGQLKTLKYTFHVHCDLVVVGIGARTSLNISKRKCKVKL